MNCPRTGWTSLPSGVGEITRVISVSEARFWISGCQVGMTHKGEVWMGGIEKIQVCEAYLGGSG